MICLQYPKMIVAIKFVSMLLICNNFAKSILLMNRNISDDKWSFIKNTVACWTSNSSAHWMSSKGPQIILKSPCQKSDQPSWNFAWQIKTESNCDALKINDFNLEKMIKIIGSNNILLVGDSVQDRFATALVNSLSDGNEGLTCSYAHPWNKDTRESVATINNNDSSFTMVSIRNDYLRIIGSNDFDQPEDPGASGHCFNFVDAIKKHNISILIMNRGAHYVKTWKLIRELHLTFSYLVYKHPNVLIIYRSTPPGVMNHESFGGFSAPLPYPQEEKIMPFNWGEFREQNELIQKMIHDDFPSILYIDVATPSRFLVHSHHDPLHVSAYGESPHNVWITLIFNAFQLIQKYSL